MDRHRTPPLRRARHLAVLVPIALLLAACPPIESATTFEGVLLDAAGAAVPNAVVYVADDTATSTASVAGAHFHIDGTDGCQNPSGAFVVRTCTDAEGGFVLSLPAPAPATVRLVFESSYWRTVLELEPIVGGGRLDVEPRLPQLEPDEEVDAAVRYALPDLLDYDLILWNDEKAIVDLIAHTQSVDADVEPLYLQIPIRQPDGTQEYVTWTNFHHDLRSEGVLDCALDADTGAAVDCEEVEGPSLTFQGMPWMEPAEIEARMVDSPGNIETLQNELLYQLSALSVIGDELDGTYYGLALDAPHTPSSLQGLRSVFALHYDPATTDRLLNATQANYLLFNHADVAGGLVDGEFELEAAAIDDGSGQAIAPANHFLEDGIKYLRPVMVADSTVFDASTSTWLVTDFRARVDAAANRQDLIFGLLNLSATEAPASLTTLSQWSNAFAVRTRIGGYRRFTEQGQERFSWPTRGCVTAPNLLTEFRSLSGDATGIVNEYWVWWTNTTRYAPTIGCAGRGGFGLAPDEGGVTWVSLRSTSNEIVARTLMHETGHLLNAPHSTTSNHQCRLFGILDVGPNSAPIMNASLWSTMTQCFEATPASATTLRNRTRVAEFLHTTID